MKRKFYFGCTDAFGNNAPDEIFIKNIYPLLAKYKIKEKDIEKIVNGIQEMCSISYDNGSQNESFTIAESEY